MAEPTVPADTPFEQDPQAPANTALDEPPPEAVDSEQIQTDQTEVAGPEAVEVEVVEPETAEVVSVVVEEAAGSNEQVAALAAEAATGVAGVHAVQGKAPRNTRISGQRRITTATSPIDGVTVNRQDLKTLISLRVVIEPDAAIATMSEQIRSNVIEAVALGANRSVEFVDIHVADVYLPKPDDEPDLADGADPATGPVDPIALPATATSPSEPGPAHT